jgi:hypothetical protein
MAATSVVAVAVPVVVVAVFVAVVVFGRAFVKA